jgi:hypothetical protein
MKGLAQRWGGPFAFRDYKMAQGIEYTPTDKDRHAVEMMAAAGITQEGIARVLEICVDTLAKYYRTELDTATDKAVAQVAGSLFQKAISDTHPQAASCAMFFLKTRGKWRENQTLHIGGDGEAPPVKVERVYSCRMRPAAEDWSVEPIIKDE